MDEAYLEKPRRWSAKNLGFFMTVMGPMSSIFDITTFVLMWYYYQAWSADTIYQSRLFETGEHKIRVKKAPENGVEVPISFQDVRL